ncbi:MAG: polyprenyl synthetase family protein [Ignavibacteriales bacterium]|nr:polyprenyl synthetase family protein [Ignavibacteriales bacterium]
MNLKDISLPIEKELKTFDEVFRNAMRSKIFLVDAITRYILKQKGKKMRPMLVLLCSKLCGGINERTYRGAALVEILHTATLIHDDVIDEANTRRGLPSINFVWKNKASVLMGDFLLAKGLLLSLDNDDFSFLKIMSDSVRRMSEGEILEIEKSRSLSVDEKTYFKIISDKTASLISTCTEIGAAAGSINGEYRNAMRDFGENLGLAFQIRDDLLDFVGKKSITGKPTGGADLKDKKITLPLIHALEKAPRTEANSILKIIKNGADKNGAQTVSTFVYEYGGIEYATGKSMEYAETAKDILRQFPNSPSKQSLLSFVDFVVTRMH